MFKRAKKLLYSLMGILTGFSCFLVAPITLSSCSCACSAPVGSIEIKTKSIKVTRYASGREQVQYKINDSAITGDSLNWSIVESETNKVSINPSTGELSWDKFTNTDRFSYKIVVKIETTDLVGVYKSAQQEIMLKVSEKPSIHIVNSSGTTNITAFYGLDNHYCDSVNLSAEVSPDSFFDKRVSWSIINTTSSNFHIDNGSISWDAFSKSDSSNQHLTVRASCDIDQENIYSTIDLWVNLIEPTISISMDSTSISAGYDREGSSNSYVNIRTYPSILASQPSKFTMSCAVSSNSNKIHLRDISATQKQIYWDLFDVNSDFQQQFHITANLRISNDYVINATQKNGTLTLVNKPEISITAPNEGIYPHIEYNSPSSVTTQVALTGNVSPSDLPNKDVSYSISNISPSTLSSYIHLNSSTGVLSWDAMTQADVASVEDWKITFDITCSLSIDPNVISVLHYGLYLPSNIEEQYLNIQNNVLLGFTDSFDQSTLSNYKYLAIPDNVTSISDNAFYNGMGKIRGSGVAISLKFSPNTHITNIGYQAFRECSGLTGDINVPEGVTTIGEQAFYGCYSVNGTLTLPSTLTKISPWAFGNLSSIRGGINIPNTVTEIGERAFTDGGWDGNLVLPDSVTKIGKYAFDACEKLTNSGTQFKLPSNLSAINQGIFYDDESLQGTLVLPNGITSIGRAAFANCEGLTGSLNIPSTVTNIGISAFSKCINLSGTLTLPSSCLYIGDYAFYADSGFTGSITLPSTLITIGEYSFSKCTGLTGSLVIPKTMSSLGKYCFQGDSGLNGTLTFQTRDQYPSLAINEYAFRDCSNLTGDLTLPEGLLTMSYGAFATCTGFAGHTLTLPKTLYNIKTYMFGIFYPDTFTIYDTIEFDTINIYWKISDLSNSVITNARHLGGINETFRSSARIHIPSSETVSDFKSAASWPGSWGTWTVGWAADL